jgi:hypothetical protein
MNPPPQEPQPIDPEAISAKIVEGQEELVRKTDALAATVDAEYAFQALVTYHLCRLTKGYTEAEHGPIPALVELAAFHLYPRFGQGGSRDPGQIQAIIDALTEQNQFRGLATAFSVDRSDKELASLQVHLRLYAESVRGSSYPPQTRRRIENIQGPFEAWFQAKAGIGPLRALAILDAFETAMNANFQSHRQNLGGIQARMEALVPRVKKNADAATAEETERLRIALGEEVAKFMEDMPLAFPASFAQVAQIVAGLTRAEWEAMRQLVGLTPESRKTIQLPRDVKDRPLYFLSGDRFIFIDISSVYDALFEAFDRLTRTDLPFRDKRYVPNLSHWMEGEACGCFLRLFPPSAVYRQLTYPDPDKPGGETELDAAVVWGQFLVLVEVKGKQFRARARVGDPSRLRDDLKDSIEEAFEQAQRATRFIEANATATFVEKGTARKLVVQKAAVRRVFPLSVTLHHFGGLATQLALLKRIGLFKDSAYPWSVSLADLDLITQFAGSPDVFLHYVQRRLDLQRSEKNIMGDELDVFGLYLDTRLHPSQFWERKDDDGKAFTLLHLSGGSERFDEWFQAEQGVRDKRPDIRLKLPPKFSAIIDELRRRDDDGARWIAFALLGLSQDAVSHIEADLDNLRSKARPDGRLLRVTINDGALVVSVVAARGMATNELRRHTAFRASIEKYRLKTTASVALGINADDTSKPFDFAFWVEGPWEADSVLDDALEKERPKIMPGQKLPGRNEPCICGSGKKFKKCCIGKVGVVRN